MEHYKIPKVLNDLIVSKFLTKKLIKINDLLSGQHSFNKDIRFKISLLTADLCDYSDVDIVVKGTIDLSAAAANENVKVEKHVAFENNAAFRSCISKINSMLIDNPEDLDLVMPMYNLLEYIQNYSTTSGSLWNCYRDDIDDVDHNASDGESFKYKTKILGKTPKRAEQYNNHHQIQIDLNQNYRHNQQYQLSILKSLFHSDILANFGDFFIYH